MPKIDTFLEIMHKSGASDLHISAGCEPMLRINGVLERAKHRILSVDEVRHLIYELLTDAQIEHVEKEGETDLAYTLPGVARFRTNIFKKHPGLGATFRIIPSTIPTLESLGLPDVLKRMASASGGLMLITGPANSGKSTTLAAIVDHMNEHMTYHIMTLEDPLEFIHTNKNCLINQRQIGEHSLSVASALRAALREDPNVVLVGEMRDLETISLALSAAEVGLLVLGTMHTHSAAQTIGRIADAFPAERQAQVRLLLSEELVGVCSQHLLPRTDGNGRVAALEIMVNTPAIGRLIREGKAHEIGRVMAAAGKEGMQLLDDHLKDLVSQNIVTVEDAMRCASDPEKIQAHARNAERPTAASPT